MSIPQSGGEIFQSVALRHPAAHPIVFTPRADVLHEGPGSLKLEGSCSQGVALIIEIPSAGVRRPVGEQQLRPLYGPNKEAVDPKAADLMEIGQRPVTFH